MAHTTVTVEWPASTNLYVAVYRLSDGKVFDWSDDTWKVAASATTPGVAMTAAVAALGSANSVYTAAIDMSRVNGTLAPVDVLLSCRVRAGGSPVLATDSPAPGKLFLTILAGHEVPPEKAEQGLFVDLAQNYTTTLGTSMHFTASLRLADGRLIELQDIDPDATCAIVVTQDGTSSGAERVPVETFTTTDCGDVNASHEFSVEWASPGLTANRGFRADVTITADGTEYTGDAIFNT